MEREGRKGESKRDVTIEGYQRDVSFQDGGRGLWVNKCRNPLDAGKD